MVVVVVAVAVVADLRHEAAPYPDPVTAYQTFEPKNGHFL
jgi:hypothetical protein